MFADNFQRQENEVKECGLKTVNEVRTSNFLAGTQISSYASAIFSRLVYSSFTPLIVTGILEMISNRSALLNK